jgi:deoxyribodipyrimidine photo-lyase
MSAHPPATRTEGLRRLQDFVPRAGRDYAARRNHAPATGGYDNVSTLSPWLRHRLLTEAEVIEAVLARHSLQAAEKFVQEVFWRSYWKGWLELRPAVWDGYLRGLDAARNRLATEGGLRADWQAACTGDTGIDAFDHWARELVATGYLHNHARMWFASIWIFTLRLPWELGADFFLRHLLDGDPASNTLSWRWVGGLHTRGKTYLATADNIAKYTDGRFAPKGLARSAPPLEGAAPPPPRALPPAPDWAAAWASEPRTGVLLTEEDMAPGFLFAPGLRPAASARLAWPEGRSPLAVSGAVAGFARAGLSDATARWAGKLGAMNGHDAFGGDHPGAVADWAAQAGLRLVVTPHAPVGPVADLLTRLEPHLAKRGVTLIRARRPWDSRAWPHATHGFFRFRDAIPALIAAERGISAIPTP